MTSPSSLSPQQLARQQAQRIFGSFVRLRLALVPFILTLAVILAALDDASWRLWLSICVWFLAIGFSAMELWRFERSGIGPASVISNVLMVGLGQGLVVYITGAIESPLLPALVITALVSGLVLELRLALVSLSLQISSLWLMVWAQFGGWLPDARLAILSTDVTQPPNIVFWITMAATMSTLLTLVTVAAKYSRGIGQDLMKSLLRNRDEVLTSHAEHAKELELLSGEIAHELKNPLATVKGLSALMAKSPTDPRNAERLSVLREETNRMHSILEEFLNFSRPLLPLQQKEVDLAALCSEVVTLHQGLAENKKVDIQCTCEGPVTAVCDPRKIKQILINLLLNAIEASLPEGVVQLTAQSHKDRILVRVRDEGPGLSESMSGRAFEPGATDKERGSGLGLTIARALARQHGGDISLKNRASGGCSVALELSRGESSAPSQLPTNARSAE